MPIVILSLSSNSKEPQRRDYDKLGADTDVSAGHHRWNVSRSLPLSVRGYALGASMKRALTRSSAALRSTTRTSDTPWTSGR